MMPELVGYPQDTTDTTDQVSDSQEEWGWTGVALVNLVGDNKSQTTIGFTGQTREAVQAAIDKEASRDSYAGVAECKIWRMPVPTINIGPTSIPRLNDNL